VKKIHQQFIAFSCVLLLQLSLFASISHAAEHPFHVQNGLCASFINFCQHDVSFDVVAPTIDVQTFLVGVFTENVPLVHTLSPACLFFPRATDFIVKTLFIR